MPITSHALDKNTIRAVVFAVSEEQNLNPFTVLAVIECESRYNTTAIGKNYKKNGDLHSKDFGLFQINDYYHLEETERLGLDVINNPIHNMVYGFYLIKKNGLKDYQASKKCISTTLARSDTS